MSSILMQLHFFVRQMGDIVVIDVLLLIILIRIYQLPELIWVFYFRSYIRPYFLLLNFSQLVIVNIQFFLTSKRCRNRIVISLLFFGSFRDATSGAPFSGTLVFFEIADYSHGSTAPAIVSLVQSLSISCRIIKVITNVFDSTCSSASR